jgi:uncharacterized protein YprB with RNaseH-like and TPR domain
MSKKPEKPNGKLLAFDLETSRLDAGRGHILTAAARWVGTKEFFKWRIDETEGYGATPRSFYNDSAIVRGLVPLVEEADAVLAYFGTGFDVPYLNTRALANGLAPPVPVTIVDPWKTARSRLKLERNSMDAVARLLKVKHQKTHVGGGFDRWRDAEYGDSYWLGQILKYNIADVECLEDVYYALRPLVKDHPYLGTVDPVHGPGNRLRCPACGSLSSKAHGSRNTRCFSVHRRRCNKCGTAFESHRTKI